MDYITPLRRQADRLVFGCLTLFRATGLVAAGLVVAGLVVASGCQGLSSSSLIPGLAESRRERQIVRQAENDPFPSPGDVGILSE